MKDKIVSFINISKNKLLPLPGSHKSVPFGNVKLSFPLFVSVQ